jgi:hypothetical protein
VGNKSGDVSVKGPGQFISQAVGSFDSVTGVTSESGAGKANAYSLQLNTNQFYTPLCNGARQKLTNRPQGAASPRGFFAGS